MVGDMGRPAQDEVRRVEKQVAAEPSPSVARGDLGWEGPVVVAATFLVDHVFRRSRAWRKRFRAVA